VENKSRDYAACFKNAVMFLLPKYIKELVDKWSNKIK